MQNAGSTNPAQVNTQQEHLVKVLCRLPDVLANRLGRYLKEGLLPKPYFRSIGKDIFRCLESIRKQFKGIGVCNCELC